MNGYVLQYVDVTHDIRVITIQLSKDKKFEFISGQYIELGVTGEDPRYFSIASAPRDDNTIDIHVRNSGQNISHTLCDNIKQGQEVYVSTPQGSLRFIDCGDPVIFLAGGTGITPFLSMMDEYPNKQISLYWGMSSEEEFYIKPRRKGLSVHYCTENYPVEAYLKDPMNDAQIYLSGPPVMVKNSKVKLLDFGVKQSNIHHD